MLLAMALPVVGLTVLAAVLRLSGTLPAVPVTGSFVARLGPLWSGLVPLALVILGLVGFALRERSAGYAFSAGLVLELAVTLGYTLARVDGEDALRRGLLCHAPAIGDHHRRGVGRRLAGGAAMGGRVGAKLRVGQSETRC